MIWSVYVCLSDSDVDYVSTEELYVLFNLVELLLCFGFPFLDRHRLHRYWELADLILQSVLCLLQLFQHVESLLLVHFTGARRALCVFSFNLPLKFFLCLLLIEFLKVLWNLAVTLSMLDLFVSLLGS